MKQELRMKWLSILNNQLKKGFINKKQFKKEIKSMKKIGIGMMCILLVIISSCSKEPNKIPNNLNPNCGLILKVSGGPVNGQYLYQTGSDYQLQVKMNRGDTVWYDLGYGSQVGSQIPIGDYPGEYYCP